MRGRERGREGGKEEREGGRDNGEGMKGGREGEGVSGRLFSVMSRRYSI